jgi:GT2 family glycosyltransferase
MILIPSTPAPFEAFEPPRDRGGEPRPLVTFLISTFNRREVLLRTLTELAGVERACGVGVETIVVDNASRDGTANAVASMFPRVRLIRQHVNRGACAKNAGFAIARGCFVMFLDDDSFPDAPSIRRMISQFENDPALGAAVFDVVLPDGSRECSAYPSVFIGCGTAFRREALEQVGGLPDDFFMQAEEYDLSLRLMARGWDVRRFDHLRVTHLKTPGARVATRTTRLDVRNNLMVVTRYFPRRWVRAFALDWMRRYWWIAAAKGWRHRTAFWRGLIEGIAMSLRPRHRRAVSAAVFERFAMVEAIRGRMERVVGEQALSSILLVDVGKNLLAFWLAARACRVRVVGIADQRLAAPGRKYRGVPVVTDEQARLMCFDAAIVANVSPVHATVRREAWVRESARPVIDLFGEEWHEARAA